MDGLRRTTGLIALSVVKGEGIFIDLSHFKVKGELKGNEMGVILTGLDTLVGEALQRIKKIKGRDQIPVAIIVEELAFCGGYGELVVEIGSTQRSGEVGLGQL